MATSLLHPGSIAGQEFLDGSVQSGRLNGIRRVPVVRRQSLQISKQPDPDPVEAFHDAPDQVIVDMVEGSSASNYEGNIVKRLAD
jgi:hypothetical protein